MLNPLVEDVTGRTVRYHGSITGLHGTYIAAPCACPVHGGVSEPTNVSVQLAVAGEVVVRCVRPRSLTLATT